MTYPKPQRQPFSRKTPVLPPMRPKLVAASATLKDNANLPELHVSALALAKLRWSAPKNDNEFNFWGVIEVEEATGRFLMKDAILAKHASNPGYSDPDMEWYGDLVMDKFAEEEIQPWQLACWIHTHPSGVLRPSGKDRDTFARNLGNQRLAFMIVMTKDLEFWGEMSAVVQPFEGVTAKTYSASPLKVTFEDPEAKPSPELEAELDALYPTLWEPYDYMADVQNIGFTTLAMESDELLRGRDEEEARFWDAMRGNYADEYDDDEVCEFLIEDPENGLELTRRQVVGYLAYHSEASADGVIAFKPEMWDLENIAEALMWDLQAYGGPTVGDAAYVRRELRKLVTQEDILQEVKNAAVTGH